MAVREERALGTQLLDMLCYVSFGQPLKEVSGPTAAAFFAEIDRFHRTTSQENQRLVSRTAIRLWQKGAAPSRAKAYVYLHNYLYWIRFNKEGREGWTQGRTAAFQELDKLLTELRGHSTGSDKANEAVGEQFPTEPTPQVVQAAAQVLMSLSRSSARSELDAFFRQSTEVNNDQSYYLLFRYSTNHGVVLKSFVTIMNHGRLPSDPFTYRHFVWPANERSRTSQIFRECEGVVIKLEKAFYLIGSNFIIPVDKRTELDRYRVRRNSARWRPDGLGCLVFEYDDVNAHPGLFGGLTLTVGDLAQPVVSRIVMLNIGTMSSLGKKIQDTDLMLDEIAEDDLGLNLLETIRKLRGGGAKRLGPELERILKAGAGEEEKASKELAALIVKMADNTPAWETSKTNSRRPRARPARGALESFGSGRPRN